MGHYLGIGAVIIILVSLLELIVKIYRELTEEPDPQQEIPFGQYEGDTPPRLPAPTPSKPKPEQERLSYSQWLQQQRGKVRDIPRERYPGQEDDIEEVNLSEAEILRQARSLASHLAAQANMELEAELDDLRSLYREIMSRGGIRRHHSEWEPQEEYTVNIPVWYRRKDGLPPDEMADEMGLTESDLYEKIAQAERDRKELMAKLPRIQGKKGWKKVKKFRVKDFIEEAKAQLEDEYLVGVVEAVSLEDIPF